MKSFNYLISHTAYDIIIVLLWSYFHYVFYYYFGQQSNTTHSPLFSNCSRKLQPLVAYVLSLGKILERRHALESDTSHLARRLKKILVDLNEYDHARSMARTFHLKEALWAQREIMFHYTQFLDMSGNLALSQASQVRYSQIAFWNLTSHKFISGACFMIASWP